MALLCKWKKKSGCDHYDLSLKVVNWDKNKFSK